jgi:hypothetical protein
VDRYYLLTEVAIHNDGRPLRLFGNCRFSGAGRPPADDINAGFMKDASSARAEMSIECIEEGGAVGDYGLPRGLAAALEGEALAAVHANQLLPVSSRLTWSGALA